MPYKIAHTKSAAGSSKTPPFYKKLRRPAMMVLPVLALWLMLAISRIACAALGLPVPLVAMGDSMLPTIETPSLVFVDASLAPAIGDVVYVSDPVAGDVCKRVAAIGPCTVSVSNGRFVDNSTKEDLGTASYTGAFDENGRLFIPDGGVFLLGDNRASSRDSSSFGAVPASSIVGVLKGARRESCGRF